MNSGVNFKSRQYNFLFSCHLNRAFHFAHSLFHIELFSYLDHHQEHIHSRLIKNDEKIIFAKI